MARSNESVIERAFARLASSEEKIVRDGLRRTLDEAVRYALAIHDGRHRRHIESGDTYGWVIIHDGVSVQLAVNARGEAIGDVTARLLRMEGRVRRTGWVGVVMAGMNPPSFFALDYEMDVMHDTVSMTERTFAEKFKPVG